jgi:nucleotide-binding universal stress UspA family protein
MKIQKVLFPTDFSNDAEQALDHAILFAKEFGAELHVLHATELLNDDPHNPAFHLPDSGEIFDRVREVTNSEMGQLISRHPVSDLKLERVQRRGSSASATILEYIEEAGIDLVVMGTHGRRGVARALIGSVAAKVVQLSPCPVMTLRLLETERKRERIAKIAVPIDFSTPATHALSVAADLAARYQASLQLVHVVENYALPDFYGPQHGERDELADQCKTELGKLMKGIEVPFTAHVAHAKRAADGIGEFLEQNGSDLVVISTQGLTGLSRFLIGSTAERVITLASCPVFALRAPEQPEIALERPGRPGIALERPSRPGIARERPGKPGKGEA